jgi:altronate dehydratase small subunit
MKGVVLDDVALLMSESDNVATVLEDLEAERTIEHEGDSITSAEDIPFGHKVAIEDIPSGGTVRKYGEVIGRTTQEVTTGGWVHTHNVESTRGRGDLDVDGSQQDE